MSRLYFLIGVLCFLIPCCMQIYGDVESENVITTYEKVIEEQEDEDLQECFARAVHYNQIQGLDYEEQLNLAGTGMMGNLEIPKINLRLPIYHGTEEDVLANGIGHMKETSLPVGGSGCHAVLTGHCGLPNAELFTRLDELKEGDPFYIHVCDQVLGYKVIRVVVVDPEDTSVAEAEAEKDLVSLVTCTPYGLNTHRLVVTGERMADLDVSNMIIEKSERGVDAKIYYLTFISVILLFCMVFRSVCWKRGGSRSAGRRDKGDIYKSRKLD